MTGATVSRIDEVSLSEADVRWLGPHARRIGERIAWPSVFQYEHQAEYGPELHPLPPSDGTPFKYVIVPKMNDVFLDLCGRGCLRDPRHSGKRPSLTDNRKSPGA